MKNILKILLGITLFSSSLLYAVTENKKNIKHNQHLMDNGYKAILSSKIPLINGKNTLNIVILKNNRFIKNSDVNIIFAFPTMPNTEFSKHAIEKSNIYTLNANFKTSGEWKYELMFKTSYGEIYSTEGKVTIN